MSQGNSYPTQATYNAQYGIIQQTMPSQAVGNFTPIQNSVQQQSFYWCCKNGLYFIKIYTHFQSVFMSTSW